MKQRLRRMYWTGVLVAALAALAAFGTLVFSKVADTRESLLSILSTASAWTEESMTDLSSLARRIADSAPPLRVTFLLPQGIVLADSEASPDDMENHLSRPEVQAALAGRTGTSVRYSTTQRTMTIYAAAQLSPMLILRLSYPLHEITGALAAYAAVFVLLFGLLAWVQRRTARRLSLELIAQLERIEGLLVGAGSGLDESAFFPELRPTMRSLHYQIRRLHEDLREIDRTQRLRRDFAAGASHELKSPLTSIQGFAEMLCEGMDDSPEERRLYAECILKESARMRAVIDDILLLSRAEMACEEQLEDVRVEAVAREVAASLAGQCRGRGIGIQVEGAFTLRAVEQDVWEMLYNLMGNAVRYGREGGHVRVLAHEGGFWVEDDGIGIAPEHIPLIFEQFYRVDKGRSRDMGGTGLGLSIVARLAAKYDGTISVQSEIGHGSRFCVSFVRNM